MTIGDTIDKAGPSARFLDQPLARKGLIVIALPLICLLIALGSVFLADQESRRAENYVRVTFAIQSDILELHALLAEGASGVRGYLLTGDDAFLAPFEKANAELPGVFARMRPLITDSEQRTRLDGIEPLVFQKLAGLNDLLEKGRRNNQMIDGEMRQTLVDNKVVLDELRSRIQQMREREDRLLEERTKQADFIRDRAQWITIIGAIFGLVGCVVAIILMSNGIVRRVASLQKAARLLATGQPLTISEHARDELGTLSRALQEASLLLKERERALRESEERFRLLVDGVHDYGIFGLDQKGRVVSWNAGAERIKGYSAEEIIGQHFSRFYPPEVRDTLPSQELERAEADGRVEDEGWRVRKDGSRFWANVVVTALHDESGNPRGFSKITRDITDRKRNEEELLSARHKAEQASEARSAFHSRLSHEFRTPLNSILGFAQILEMDVTEPEMQASLAQILRAGRHLLSLLDDLLDLARIDAGRMELYIETLDAGEVIGEAVDLARPLAASRNVGIAVEIGPVDGVAVTVDRRRFLQVLLNLLSNAIKFNREHGMLRVSARLPDSDTLAIDISDNGFGIAEGRKEHLFQPFERLGADSNATSGTGLGLALSKNLMEAMGGRLELASSDAEGSTFTVLAPAAPRAAVTSRPAIAETPDRPASKPGLDLVLCIEDNLASLNLIENVLTRHCAAKVIPAMLGSLGLTLAREHRPDLILLDIDLPDIGGLEVLKSLKADGQMRNIPVIVITADATETTRQRAQQEGATRVLTKPLDIRQFLQLLDEVMAQ
ncbi:PAS domain S-box protein [Rhizobium sp. BK602]|uniref:PAS domain S-box protein n=1 Tax=Rhizobium sp. BK602 TaxID=2586986 RepID=UPI00185D561C|nr:PAS domain S-box protein [Rhizobium sp. BK602]MBB3609772.1 PAS domain S-box-containing protein [Rhizobium sp. BK602]